MNIFLQKRVEKRLSQVQLAYLAQLSEPTIWKIENGHPVSRKSLILVCRVLGIDHSQLGDVALSPKSRRK